MDSSRALNDYSANLPEKDRISANKKPWWEDIKKTTSIMSDCPMEKNKVELVIAQYNN